MSDFGWKGHVVATLGDGAEHVFTARSKVGGGGGLVIHLARALFCSTFAEGRDAHRDGHVQGASGY